VHRRLVGINGSESSGLFCVECVVGAVLRDRRGEEGEMIDRRGHRGRWDDGVREQKVSGSSDCWYRGHFPMVECIGILRGVFTQVFFSFLLRMCCFWWFNCVRWVEISSFSCQALQLSMATGLSSGADARMEEDYLVNFHSQPYFPNK
jgi:hypothetical protein